MTFSRTKRLRAVIIALLSIGITAYAINGSDANLFKTWFTEDYKVKAPYIPDQLSFCGEKVPLNDPEVRERLDRELMATVYWQSNTMMLLKRSKKFFPVIDAILKEQNIPLDFRYLCVAESGLSNATSPSGAKGFWQLMEQTARPYGLEVNAFVDERFHLEKATAAACSYFKEAYSLYTNWTLTAASYNRGMNGITRDLEFQGTGSFYDLYLNEETARYVFRILAYKLIFEQPEMYGFYLKESDYYQPPMREVIRVDSSISNLSVYARDNGTDYRTLKTLNPWLRDRTLPNKTNKVYAIELPYKDE